MNFVGVLLIDNDFSKSKITRFECGFHRVVTLQKSFRIQFFSIILIFVVFDVEVVLFLGFIVKLKVVVSIILLMSFILVGLWLEWFLGKLVWLN